MSSHKLSLSIPNHCTHPNTNYLLKPGSINIDFNPPPYSGLLQRLDSYAQLLYSCLAPAVPFSNHIINSLPPLVPQTPIYLILSQTHLFLRVHMFQHITAIDTSWSVVAVANIRCRTSKTLSPGNTWIES